MTFERIEELPNPQVGIADIPAGAIQCVDEDNFLWFFGDKWPLFVVKRPLHNTTAPLAPEVILCAEHNDRFYYVVYKVPEVVIHGPTPPVL